MSRGVAAKTGEMGGRSWKCPNTPLLRVQVSKEVSTIVVSIQLMNIIIETYQCAQLRRVLLEDQIDPTPLNHHLHDLLRWSRGDPGPIPPIPHRSPRPAKSCLALRNRYRPLH